MSRIPQSVQKKRNDRAEARIGTNDRMHSKEGFSSHGEQRTHVKLKNNNEDAMFAKMAVHTHRDRSNHSKDAGKPGPPGKSHLPFEGKRKFAVLSPSDYSYISQVSDEVRKFHRVPLTTLCWLYNVLFSKTLRIKRSAKYKNTPSVPHSSILRAFENIVANTVISVPSVDHDTPGLYNTFIDLGFINYSNTSLYSAESITNIRVLSSHQAGVSGSVVPELKRYMSYDVLKAFRSNPKKLVTFSEMAEIPPLLIPDESDSEHAPPPIPTSWSDYLDWSEFLSPAEDIFVPSSELNGNNGSWTGTDDHDKVAECCFGCECTICCHFHLNRKRDGGEKKPPQTALKGAAKRLAEKKDLTICKVENCSDKKCHYHLPDLCVCINLDTSPPIFDRQCTEHMKAPLQPERAGNRKAKTSLAAAKLEAKRNQIMAQWGNENMFSAFESHNPYGVLECHDQTEEHVEHVPVSHHGKSKRKDKVSRAVKIGGSWGLVDEMTLEAMDDEISRLHPRRSTKVDNLVCDVMDEDTDTDSSIGTRVTIEPSAPMGADDESDTSSWKGRQWLEPSAPPAPDSYDDTDMQSVGSSQCGFTPSEEADFVATLSADDIHNLPAPLASWDDPPAIRSTTDLPWGGPALDLPWPDDPPAIRSATDLPWGGPALDLPWPTYIPPDPQPPHMPPVIVANRVPTHIMMMVNPLSLITSVRVDTSRFVNPVAPVLSFVTSPVAWMASKRILLGACRLISSSAGTSTFPSLPLQDLQTQRLPYENKDIYLATPTDKSGFFGFIFDRFDFVTTPSLGASEIVQYDTAYFRGLFSIASYSFEKTWLDVGYNKYVTHRVYTDLSTWVHQYSLRKSLTTIELYNGMRKFRIKKHAYEQIRYELETNQPLLFAIRAIDFEAFEITLVHGLQQSMPIMNLQFGGESSRTPQVDSLGKVSAPPCSLTWKLGL